VRELGGTLSQKKKRRKVEIKKQWELTAEAAGCRVHVGQVRVNSVGGQVHVGQVPVTRRGVMVTANIDVVSEIPSIVIKATYHLLLFVSSCTVFPFLMARGNKGFFFGAPLQLLRKHLPEYLISRQKNKLWKVFWPEWDSTYPMLDTDKLQQELGNEEKAFLEATTCIKEQNMAATKGKLCRKAKHAKLPSTSAQLDELCARASDHAVHIFYSIYVLPIINTYSAENQAVVFKCKNQGQKPQG
jgi:hypothetical protein